METPLAFTELELDALKELMNTGVGKSARALSELLGRHVRLSVPSLGIIDREGVKDLLKGILKGDDPYSVAKQTFSGPLSGTGIFLLTHAECENIAAMIGLSQDSLDGVVTDIVEELMNLVLVSCVGYMASNLGHKSHFSPPHFQGTMDPKSMDVLSLAPEGDAWIGLRTSFTFKDSESDGHLFLAIDTRSSEWLKEALNAFIRGFECCTTYAWRFP